jgi:flagellar motility protein MotE (MotC chaperone)
MFLNSISIFLNWYISVFKNLKSLDYLVDSILLPCFEHRIAKEFIRKTCREDQISSRYFRILVTIFLLNISSEIAFAQYSGNMWGTGMSGGSGGQCPYQASNKIDIGDEATSIKDDIADANDQLKQIQDDLKNAKKELKEKMKNLEKAQSEFDRSGFGKDSSVYSLVNHHLEQNVSCEDYHGLGPQGATESSEPFAAGEWSKICNTNNNDLDTRELCSNSGVGGLGSQYNVGSCSSALKDWQRSSKALKNINSKIESLTEALKNQKRAIADLKKDFKRAVRDHLSGDGGGGEPSGGMPGGDGPSSEAGCYECMLAGNGSGPTQNAGPSVTQTALDVGGNVALGLGAMYFGNQAYKNVSKENAQLGYPTAPVSSFGYGYPYFSGALYGATSGGGSAGGSFGCSPSGSSSPGGMAGGGAFGYPSGMTQSPMGGGMYLPGSGSWGSNGPWGLGGNSNGIGNMMNPYSGYGGGTMNPYSGYGGGTMNPYSGYNGGMMNPYSSYGGYGNYGMTNPYSNYGGGNGIYGMSNPYTGYGTSGGSSQLLQLMMSLQLMQSGSLYGNSYNNGYGYLYRPYSNTNTLPGVYSPSYYNNSTTSGTPTVR